jgi:hypothetical protein
VWANACLSFSWVIFFYAGEDESKCSLWFKDRGNFRHGGGWSSWGSPYEPLLVVGHGCSGEVGISLVTRPEQGRRVFWGWPVVFSRGHCVNAVSSLGQALRGVCFPPRTGGVRMSNMWHMLSQYVELRLASVIPYPSLWCVGWQKCYACCCGTGFSGCLASGVGHVAAPG